MATASKTSAGTPAKPKANVKPKASVKPKAAEPDAPKVKGPASYFPSIEKTYGKPISTWLDVLAAAGERKHLELVTLLKTEHGVGHGHANALVAHFVASR